MKLFFYFILTVQSFTIRTHSVIWRNHNNSIVKQVVYAPNARFTPMFANEMQELCALPSGWKYDVRCESMTKRLYVKARVKLN